MKLNELLDKFPDEFWCDICTPQFRTCGYVKNIKNQLDMDTKVDTWKVDSKNILMINL